MTQITDIPLNRETILASLSTGIDINPGKIHLFAELNSTNQWLLEQGDCGDICLAESQHAGRGRRGRAWQSPPRKNICFSLRWCFERVPELYGCLGLQVGLAVVRALQEAGIQKHGLKWPNDIYYQGRKLGGILLQTAQPLQHVVIGIGLNINMQADAAATADIDQPWCSLVDILDEPLDRNHIVSLLLNHLLPALQQFPSIDQLQFAEEWRQWDILAGRQVQIHDNQQTFSGYVQGINPQGQLDVLLNNNERRYFSAADVSVRW